MLAGHGHVGDPRLVLNGDHVPGAVGFVAEQPRVDHLQASGQFVGHLRKYFRRGRPTRDQGGDPAQRGLLLREHAELVMARLDLPTAQISLGGARSGQPRDGCDRKRDNQKDSDCHPVLRPGRDDAAAGLQMVEGHVDNGAGQRRHRPEPESPQRGDHENAQQQDHTEDVSGGDPFEQVHQEALRRDQ